MFQMKSAAELSAMSYDELVAENMAAGVAVDELRDYRRDVKARYSVLQQSQVLSAQFGTDLTPEQARQINAIVNAPKLTINTEVQK